MSNRNLSRYFWTSLGGIAIASPLAVVIACGETTPAPTPETPTPETPVVPTVFTANALAWQPGSTNEQVTWTGSVSVTGDDAAKYAPVEYLSGTYATQEAAAVATTWSAALPTRLAFAATTRNLWARALPVTGQAVTTFYLDLTALSKVQDVPSDVNAQPALAELKTALEAATITGASLNELELSLPAVPAELPLAFQVQVNEGAWFSADGFNGAMTMFSNTYQLNDPLAIRVRLELVGKADSFIFTPPAVRELDVTEVKFYLQSGASLYDGDFSAAASVSHDKLTYTGVVKVIGADKTNYGPVEYLTGNYPTRAAAEATASWSADLPTTTTFAPSERFFWVRALPIATAPETSKAMYANITGDPASTNNRRSGIREVKGNVNAAPTFVSIDLTQLTIVSTDINAVTLTGAPDLTTLPLALELQINDSAWFAASAFSAQVATLKLTYQANAPLVIRARLTLADPNRMYLFVPPAPTTLDSTTLQAALENVAVLDTSALRVDLNKSLHHSLEWSGRALIKGAGAPNYLLEYLASEATTTEAANAATDWNTNLPSATSFLPADRHLYVRMRPVDEAAGLTTFIEDVTVVSEIQAVKAFVGILPEYGRAVPTSLSLYSYQPPAGAPDAARQLIVVNVPTFSVAPIVTQISFDGGATWIDSTDTTSLSSALAEFVLNRADLTVPPVFQARFALRSDATWARLDNPQMGNLKITEAFAKDLYNAAPTVEVDISSIISSQWSPFVVNDGAWAVWGALEENLINQEEYDAHKAVWDDTNARTKLDDLPDPLKGVIVGFETLNYRKTENSVSAAEVATLEITSTYQNDNLFFWRWEDEREKWQWKRETSSNPRDTSSLWARVKFAQTKKYVAKQTNAWSIMRSSRYYFANNGLLFDYEAITPQEFNEAETFLQQNIRRDAVNSTTTKLVFLPITADIPAAMQEGRFTIWFSYRLENENFNRSEIVDDLANLPEITWPATKTLQEFRVEFFGTRVSITKDQPGPKTYIPGTLLDFNNDIVSFTYGAGRVVKNLDIFAAS